MQSLFFHPLSEPSMCHKAKGTAGAVDYDLHNQDSTDPITLIRAIVDLTCIVIKLFLYDVRKGQDPNPSLTIYALKLFFLIFRHLLGNERLI